MSELDTAITRWEQRCSENVAALDVIDHQRLYIRKHKSFKHLAKFYTSVKDFEHQHKIKIHEKSTILPLLKRLIPYWKARSNTKSQIEKSRWYAFIGPTILNRKTNALKSVKIHQFAQNAATNRLMLQNINETVFNKHFCIIAKDKVSCLQKKYDKLMT